MNNIDKFIDVCESYIIEDNYANESKLNTLDRSKLPDSAFGLPKERKYPLYLKNKEESESHINNAIKFFMYCPENKRKQLANNIKKAADKYGISIGPNAMINKYL